MDLSEEQQQRILVLKHEAVEHKKNGNITKAKSILGQIREIEFEGMEVEDCNDPLLLKQLALVFKAKGDITNAKNALLKSKKMLDIQKQQQQQQQQQQQDQQQQQKDQQQQPQQHDQQQEKQQHQQQPPQQVQQQVEETTVDDGASEESMGTAGNTTTNNNANVTFTDEEMLDKEMMCELKTAGIEVPSEEQYQHKIIAYKQAALNSKNNKDIQSAKSYLLQAKKFEYASRELAKITVSGGAAGGGMHDLLRQGNATDINAEEEEWLLKELAGEGGGVDIDHDNNDDPTAICFDTMNQNSNDFELDDLDDLDAEMLKAMIDSGMMNVPHPDEIFDIAKEKKINATNLMKEKNVDAAKAYLAESKRLTKRAKQLQHMLQQIEEMEGNTNKASITDLSALENMLGGNNNNNGARKKEKIKEQQQQSNNSNQDRNNEQSKDTRSSEEIKKEVFRLKKENKIKEATFMLRLYKAKIAEENHTKDIKKRKDVITEIVEVELPLAKEQIRLFQFYERFVCPSATTATATTSEDDKKKNIIGSQHLKFWKRYQQDCIFAIKNIRESIDKNSVHSKVEVLRGTGAGTNGSDDVKDNLTGENKTTNTNTGKIMTRIAKFDEQLSFVGNNGNTIEDDKNTDLPLEVAILSVSNLTDNKHFQKLLKDQTKQQQRVQKANAAIASANGKNASSIKAAASEVLSSSQNSSCGRYPLLQGTIQVQVILQIPPNKVNTDKNISLPFSSCSSLLHQANAEDDATIEGNYDYFGKSRFVKLPRLPKGINIHDRKQLRQHQKEKGSNNSSNNIEYAAIVHKRMERKKIQINVFYDPTPAQLKNDSGGGKNKVSKLFGGFFGGKKKKAPLCDCTVCDGSSDEDSDGNNQSSDAICKKWKLLGKVVIELNHFLNNNYIAGDFSLQDTTKKDLGGSIRLGMKMNHPYDNSSTTAAAEVDKTTPTTEINEEHDDDDEEKMKHVITGIANNIDMIPYNAMIFRPIIMEPPT